MAFPPLMPQQATASQFIQTRPYAGVFLDMSGGKSLAVLHALTQVRPSGHVLVIAPVKIARISWISEIEKWDVNVRCRSLIVNDNDKKLTLAKRVDRYAELLDPQTPPTLWFINQDLVVDLVSWFQAQSKATGQTSSWPFPTVIIDESQGFKNPSSKRFKALKTVRSQISRMILLSGTPTPNGLEDLWSQVWLLDQGAALGSTLTAYRTAFFHPTAKSANGAPVNWKVNPGAEQIIFSRVSHLVMSATTVSRTPMPQMNIHDVMVSMSPETKRAYDTLRRELVLDLVQSSGAGVSQNGHVDLTSVSASNAAVLRGKLIQLASGTAYLDDDPDTVEDLQQAGITVDPRSITKVSQALTAPNRRQYSIVHTAKPVALLRLVRQADGPVLVAYYYTCDRDIITSYLLTHGYDVRVFDGSRTMYDAWNRGEIQVMVVHPASSGHGLNLQGGGHTLIWYTLPTSLEHYLQTNKRLHRVGQKHDVDIYRILTKDTIDMLLPSALDKKDNLQRSLLDAVEKSISDISI